MNNMVIGALEAYLKLNAKDFLGTLDTVSTKVFEITKKFDAFTVVGEKFTKIGKTMTVGLTTPIVGLGTACVKTTADFDSAMAKVSAISGSTGDELLKLRDKAKEMGEKTKFSATESAEAFTYMAMAGWDSAQMIDGIAGIMNLAAADGLDLATTSDIVTDALTAFGLQAKDSAHFADVLAKASSSANTNVSMLGDSFKYVAPVAGSLGYSVEDTAVALGLMANAGIKGSQAGTSLRAALTRMIKPTQEASNLMNQYGISMVNSDGSMKSLGEVMNILREKLGNLTEAEQAQIAAELFGQEAMSGMLSIINASEKDYNKLTEAIANADGTAEKMANTMNDNLKGKLTLLKSQLEGVAIQIGEKLIPPILKILDIVSVWIQKFSELFESHGNLILVIAGVVAALGPVIFIVGKILTSLGKVTTALTLIRAIVGICSPAFDVFVASLVLGIGTIVTSVGILVGAFVNLWNKNEEFRNKMTTIWNDIVSKVKDFCQGIKERINALGLDFGGIIDFIKDRWEKFCSIMAPIFEGTFSQISNILSVCFDVLTGLLDVFIGIFTGNWKLVWQGVKEIFIGVWDGIKNILKSSIDMIRNIIKIQMEIVKNDWNMVWSHIKQTIFNILSSIKSNVINSIQAIKSFMSNAWNSIKNTAVNTWNGLKNSVVNIINSIKTSAVNTFNSMKSTLTSAVQSAKTSIINGFNSMKSGISRAMVGVKSAIVSGFNNAVSFIKRLPSQAVGWGKDMVNGFKKGVKNAMTGLINTVKGMAQSIKGFLHFSRPDVGPLRDYETWMPDMVAGLSKTLESASPFLIDKVKNLSEQMQTAFTEPKYEVALAGIGGGNIRVGAGIKSNDYSELNKAGKTVVEKTEIHIEKIEVRDDHDLDMVTQGLYNKQDQNLRALGRRNI